MIDSDKFVWSEMQDTVEESVTVHFRVTSEDDGQFFRWRYRVVNTSLNADPDWPSLDWPGVHSFRLRPEGFDLSGLDDVTATRGWEPEAALGWEQYAGPGYWQAATSPGEDYIPIGKDGTITFRTEPRPVVEGVGAVEGDLETSGLEGLLKGPGVQPTVSIDVPKLIPVNANNDNFKPNVVNGSVTNEADRWLSVAQPFIPKRRDFSVGAGEMWRPDPQLKPVTLTVTHSKAGVLKARVSGGASDEGQAKLWKRPDKSDGLFTEIPLAASADGSMVTESKVVYIEGVHESARENDVMVHAEFTQDEFTYYADPRPLQVAPYITRYYETETSKVNFINQHFNNGLLGIQAFGLDGRPGIKISTESATTDDIRITYVQYITHDVNGHKAGGGAPSVTFASGVKAWLVLDPALQTQPAPIPANAKFPLLDGDQVQPGQLANPEYDKRAADNPEVVGTNPNRVRVTIVDNPAYRYGPEFPWGPNVEKIDRQKKFETFLVARFTDGSIYAIAYMYWDVVLYADTVQPNQGTGPNNISADSKVYASEWIRSNNQPKKTAAPVANGALKAVYNNPNP